jgi:transposase
VAAPISASEVKVTVAVASFDVASRAHEAAFDGVVSQLAEDRKEIQAFLSSLPPGTVVALESTGGYGNTIIDVAFRMGLTIYLLKPILIKKYRQSLGIRAKTDRIDALVIGDYVRLHQDRLHPHIPCPEPYKTLRDLVRQRVKLMEMKVQMRSSLKDCKVAEKQVKAALKAVDTAAVQMDKEILKHLKTVPKATIALSVVGIGPLAAAAGLCATEHLPFKDSDKFVAFMGLDPAANDSGKRTGRRRLSKTGYPLLRKIFYLCAMSASLCKTWRAYYLKKLAGGLKRTEALVALARKLARAFFSVVRSGKPFYEPQCSLKAVAT